MDEAALGRSLSAARAALARDAGTLWGIDPRPAWLIAVDDAWLLTAPAPGAQGAGELWRVEPDPDVRLGNSTLDWRGRRWATIATPDPTPRLLLHEAFHAFWQEAVLGPADEPIGDDALAQPGPRAWLRVELAAAAHAIRAGDPGAVAAYAAIRRHRLARLSAAEAARQEHFDAAEGLAEYSALRWTGAERAEVAALAEAGPPGRSWVRSACYTSGPALGHVLDRATPDWRARLVARRCALTALLPAADVDPEGAAERLGLERLVAGEEGAAREAAAAESAQRARFASILWVPVDSVAFNPATAIAWPEGTFYEAAGSTSARLVVDAPGGAIIAPDYQRLGLPVSGAVDLDRAALAGDGWTLRAERPLRELGAALVERG